VAASPAQTRRVERVLATSRVFLATCFLAALYLDRSQPGHRVLLAYEVVLLYLVHAIIVMWLVRFRRQSTRYFRLMVHFGDIGWPAVIAIFAAGPNSPLFLFFIFVLVAAAYRWALWETLATALASIAVLLAEVMVASRWAGSWIGMPVHTDPQQLIVGCSYLLVMGILLGYLAEHEKRLQSERAVVARVLSKARVDLGLTGTLQGILQELLDLWGAEQAIVAVEETNTSHCIICQTARNPSGELEIQWLEPAAADRAAYLFRCPADAWYTRRRSTRRGYITRAVDGNGARLLAAPSLFERIAERRPFESAIGVSLSSAQEWSGRLLMFEPVRLREEGLRFLQELVRQASPAVSNVYLLRRLRQRAGAMERARVARELHDGAIQSLIAVEMQVDVLRRQSEPDGPRGRLQEELARIQKLLREEVLKLRDLMQKTKPLLVDGGNLVPFVQDAVRKFQRETGISTRFVADVQQVALPPMICRELARIAQEALVNVRKHSEARNVVVHMGHNNSSWTMVVEDDGRGFDFAGRLLLDELVQSSTGPAVIKERVKTIAGELRIDSTPGKGARIEIRVPMRAKAATRG
jgi:signal transduction histidine kinase